MTSTRKRPAWLDEGIICVGNWEPLIFSRRRGGCRDPEEGYKAEHTEDTVRRLADQSLASQRGEFRLIPLPNGSTRLEGRTWYTFDMHPQAYWSLWSDLAIHAIHRRVLNHIKQLAEAKPAALPKLSPQTKPAEEQL